MLHLTTPQIREETLSDSKHSIWKINLRSGEPAGIVQELAYLTISMKKNMKPTASKAFKFYEFTDLYPFRTEMQMGDEGFKDSDLDRSYMVITEKD